MKLKQLLILAALAMPFSVGSVNAATVYDEATSGDAIYVWNDFDTGTAISLAEGENLIFGNDSSSDHDYDSFVFTLDSGLAVDSISITYSNVSADKSTYYNTWKLGEAGVQVESDSSALFSNLAATQLFSALPLVGDGSTLFYIGSDGGTNLGSTTFDYTLDINVIPSAVPLPAALWLFGPALLGFMGFRRKAVKVEAA